jgi:hypothetical protein
MLHHRLAWVLLILFQLQLAPMRELIKLPMLWLHFQEDGDDGSFMEFIYIHYRQEQIPDADWQKDLNLPFKDGNQYHFLDLAILNESFVLGATIDQTFGKICWGRQHWHNSTNVSDIFHPPNRFASY